MLSSSKLVASQLSDSLDEIVTLSNIVRSDSTVQSVLDEIHNPNTIYGAHYYTRIYSSLQQHYLESDDDYIKFMAISCPRFVSYTYGYTKDHLSSDKLDSLVGIAEKADGSAVWVTDGVSNDGLYLVREIKKIENLSLDNLGTFIVKIDLDQLISDISDGNGAGGDSLWIIYDKSNLIYSSPEIYQEDIFKITESVEDYGVISIDGQPFFAVHGTTNTNTWNYLHLMPYKTVADSRKNTMIMYFVLLFVGLVCTFIIMRYVVNKTTRHFNTLILRMELFGQNSDILPTVPYDYSHRTDEIGMLHRQFEKMATEIQTLVVEKYKLELLSKDARLKELESQMNPHFLYNTLDSIHWRAKAIGETQISQIVESLGHFLRKTLQQKEQDFSLREEIEIIHYYITIQQLRFDNRLNFSMNIPEIYQDAKVPQMSIQPLIENAVHYALEQVADDCLISLSCVKQDSILQIYVKNSGSEFPENILEKLKNHEIKEKGLGIALLNIQDRIQLMFGDNYGMHFYNENEFAVVRLEIPYIPITNILPESDYQRG
jgi:two-component system sensor histidine kinase YesM